MRRFLAALLLVGLAVAAAGCTASKGEPSLTVTLEQSGSDLVVHMETTNFVLGKTGHAHIRLDGGPEVMPNTKTYIIPNVKPGKHSVAVDLSDPSHKLLGIRQLAEIDIK